VSLDDYTPIVGKSTIEELKLISAKLQRRVIQNINSTFTGGGVVELLSRIVPLLQQLGIDARWNIIEATPDFYQVTKKFHNLLHGRREEISNGDYRLFTETTQKNIEELEINGDIVFVHDPQPVGLVDQKKETDKKWIWRCHIDVSHADHEVWRFLEQFVVQYDAAVFSSLSFSRELPIPQYLISPSIDPLSDKNRDLPLETVDAVLAKYGIYKDKPIITQVSRFDYLKDPVGMIQAFEMVRSGTECQLVLAGGTASDDPESERVLSEVRERASSNQDIHVLLIPPGSDIEINALQRASTIIVQKSLREGFALTVSEALWKAKPVVASAVGGIPLQVRNRFTGLLSHGIEGTAYAIRQLLSNPDYARWLGENGREHIRHNFLITRHLRDELLLFLTLEHPEDVVRF
jgi:trehalose synthase